MQRNNAKDDKAGMFCCLWKNSMPIAMRNFVNDAMKLTKGCSGVFVGNDREGWRYVLGSLGQDIRAIGKELNQNFQGKGGGKPPMIQGSLVGTEGELRGFLQMFQEIV